MLDGYAKTELELMVGKNEKILWQGKPDKKCFVLEGIFNPTLPFVLVWFLFDSFILTAAFFGINDPEEASGGSPFFVLMLLFILVHMTPVWIYLAGALLVVRKYKHTEYIITDKGVYVSGGLFSYSCKMKPFTELARVNIHRGVIDQHIGVGDVVLTSNNVDDAEDTRIRINGKPIGHIGTVIQDIRDYRKVFELIKKLQEDIYTDSLYPNDLRPKENHGYKTKYKGLKQ